MTWPTHVGGTAQFIRRQHRRNISLHSPTPRREDTTVPSEDTVAARSPLAVLSTSCRQAAIGYPIPLVRGLEGAARASIGAGLFKNGLPLQQDRATSKGIGRSNHLRQIGASRVTLVADAGAALARAAGPP